MTWMSEIWELGGRWGGGREVGGREEVGGVSRLQRSDLCLSSRMALQLVWTVYRYYIVSEVILEQHSVPLGRWESRQTNKNSETLLSCSRVFG